MVGFKRNQEKLNFLKMRILTLLFLALSVSLFAQTNKSSVHTITRKHHIGTDSTSVPADKVQFYAAVGVSIGNSGSSNDSASFMASFKGCSYPSIEFGITKKNLSLGAVFGKSDFTSDKTYFWESKCSAGTPIGPFTGSLLFGIGNYFSTNQIFIEYGTCISLPINAYCFNLQISNWDAKDYISLGISRTF